MHFLRYVSSIPCSIRKMLSGKKKRLSTVSSSASIISSTMSFATSSTSSERPLYAVPALIPNHAEMMDEEDMAWGPPKSRRR